MYKSDRQFIHMREWQQVIWLRVLRLKLLVVNQFLMTWYFGLYKSLLFQPLKVFQIVAAKLRGNTYFEPVICSHSHSIT